MDYLKRHLLDSYTAFRKASQKEVEDILVALTREMIQSMRLLIYQLRGDQTDPAHFPAINGLRDAFGGSAIIRTFSAILCFVTNICSEYQHAFFTKIGDTSLIDNLYQAAVDLVFLQDFQR